MSEKYVQLNEAVIKGLLKERGLVSTVEPPVELL